MELDKMVKLVERVEKVIEEHSRNIHGYVSEYGDPAEKLQSILHYHERTSSRSISYINQFRDDMVRYLRAMAMIGEMTGNAATHAEKNARLRGMVELIEGSISTLLNIHIEANSLSWSYKDIFASNYPVREYIDALHKVEHERDDYKKRYEELYESKEKWFKAVQSDEPPIVFNPDQDDLRKF